MVMMMMVLALAIILIVVTTATVIILLRLRLSCCYNYYYCCSWQHVRLPPRGVCRFLCWHVLKLEFWHSARPKLNLGFVFASVFAVFSSKKMPQPAGCTVQKHAQLSISHRFFFGVFLLCRISHRFLQCFGHLSTFCTCRLRIAFVFQLCAGVWGGDGAGGGFFVFC